MIPAHITVLNCEILVRSDGEARVTGFGGDENALWEISGALSGAFAGALLGVVQGKLGRQLELMYEIKLNGLEQLIYPLVPKQ